MADKKISALTALTAANVAPATDVVPIVDTSATETKKITAKDLVDGALNGGTANGVLYLNGSKAATSGSALVFDGTNLGIGTSSPDYKLEVEGTGVVRANIHSTSVSGARNAALRLQVDSSGGDDAAGIIEFTYGTGATQCAAIDSVLSSAASAGILRFFTSTTERMRLDSSGNLGIGTSSPGARVHAYSGTAMAQMTVDGIGAIKTGINFANGGTTYGQIYFDNVGPYDMTVFQQYTTGSLRFGTNNTERMRITSGGDFLVGATSGSYRLTVNVASGADREILIAGVSGASNGLSVKWNHSTTTTRVNIANIPTSSAGLTAGDLWNDGGTIKIA